jgi:hypothetical protein
MASERHSSAFASHDISQPALTSAALRALNDVRYAQRRGVIAMGHAESWVKFLLAAIGHQSGQTLAEYTLMLAVVVTASVMAGTAISVATNSYFTEFLEGFV